MNEYTSTSAFELLHSSIREQLYRMQWTELRPVQAEAAHLVIKTDAHLMISAMTAGGKTEAAFLPVLSLIADSFNDSVRAVYVGPLKALINDQFRRIEDLCKRAEIPVHRWHGDVGASSRKSLLQNPSGVLLITPESIESLFINHPDKVSNLFKNLSFIVIDEIHSFMGSERGAHLKSVLSRLMKKSQNPVRLIGLSATLGDMNLARQWMWPRNPENVRLITGESGEKTVRIQVKGYVAGDSSGALTGNPGLAEDLVKHFYGKTALVFANSKSQLEIYTDLAGRILDHQKRPNVFRIHHGSLSKEEREDTEEELRSETPTVTFCSSTLEMGIDVGNVEAVGQVGAPWSVSSLKQRLGRSGRRDNEVSILRMYIEEPSPTPTSSLLDQLFPELLQGIAMVELLLEGWCEPPDVSNLHVSTFIQQVLSVITEHNGANAGDIFNTLVLQGSFTNIDKPLFMNILRSIGAADLIEQTPEGDLILGLAGEKIVRSFDFYSAFKARKDLRVIHRGAVVGTIALSPGVSSGGCFVLAGRRWKIVQLDMEHDEVLVEPSAIGRLPSFSESQGIEIHRRIHEKMRDILIVDSVPAYLDETARNMLRQARDAARKNNIVSSPLVKQDKKTIWFTWAGSEINRTLFGLGLLARAKVEDEGFALVFDDMAPDEIRELFIPFLSQCPTVEEVAAKLSHQVLEKYESYLSSELQCLIFAKNRLDLPGTLELLKISLLKNK